MTKGHVRCRSLHCTYALFHPMWSLHLLLWVVYQSSLGVDKGLGADALLHQPVSYGVSSAFFSLKM